MGKATTNKTYRLGSQVFTKEDLMQFASRLPVIMADPDSIYDFLVKNRERGEEYDVQWLEQGLKFRFGNQVYDLQPAIQWFYYPKKRVRATYKDEGVSVHICYPYPVFGAAAYYDPNHRGQLQPVPEDAEHLTLTGVVWMLTFSSTGAGPDEKAHSKRVIELRRMLREYTQLQRQAFPDLPSAYGAVESCFESASDSSLGAGNNDDSWWFDDDDDDDDKD